VRRFDETGNLNEEEVCVEEKCLLNFNVEAKWKQTDQLQAHFIFIFI
jgi:hypothetical protein